MPVHSVAPGLLLTVAISAVADAPEQAPQPAEARIAKAAKQQPAAAVAAKH